MGNSPEQQKARDQQGAGDFVSIDLSRVQLKDGASASPGTNSKGPEIESAIQTLRRDGVVVLTNVLSPSLVAKLKEAHDQLLQKVQEETAKQEPQPQAWPYDGGDGMSALDTPTWTLSENQDLGTVIQTTPGRFDYSLNIEEGPFASEEFLNPAALKQVVESLLKGGYSQDSVGALPVLPGAPKQPFHRDTLLMQRSEAGEGGESCTVDQLLANDPCYLTVLIQLVPMNKTNGSTEFIPGSHRERVPDVDQATPVSFEVDPGSIIIFDGRILHRGCGNPSNETRAMLYQTYVHDWYIQSIARDER